MCLFGSAFNFVERFTVPEKRTFYACSEASYIYGKSNGLPKKIGDFAQL